MSSSPNNTSPNDSLATLAAESFYFLNDIKSLYLELLRKREHLSENLRHIFPQVIVTTSTSRHYLTDANVKEVVDLLEEDWTVGRQAHVWLKVSDDALMWVNERGDLSENPLI